MITKEEVQHIAKLARLGLTKKEIEKFQNELSSILDYVEKLKEVDVLKVEPTSHSIKPKRIKSYVPGKVENVNREDKESEKGETKSEKLLNLAPETKKGYLKVKSILQP